MKSYNAGFTLMEMAVVVSVIGILTILLNPVYSSFITSKKQAYSDKQTLQNRAIGQALLDYAAQQTALGTLPEPYTGNGYNKTIYNPADTTANGIALASLLAKSEVPSAEINDDGTGAHNVRVFQKLSGLTFSTPLYFRSGPLVTLKYDFGAIYMTSCRLADTSCNPNSTTGAPGATTTALTSSNYSSWTTTGTDRSPYFVSTLSLQKQMLQTTVTRLDKLRDAFTQYNRTLQLGASPGDKTNFYPPNPGTLVGKTPSANQGCRDGWYDLSTNSPLLSYIGLSALEYGVTAWGGAIHYCRNYDPYGVGSETTPPYYAALRINTSVSDGLAPDATNQGANVFFSF